jgi:hypothetical protein
VGACTQGSNGFLMVGEDGMKDALKAASAVQKKNATLRKTNPKLLTVRLHSAAFPPARCTSCLPRPFGPLAGLWCVGDVKQISSNM